MRVAIVSDIHGNLTALEAVIADLEQVAPDVVYHGGDLATNGARGAEVVDRVRELGWEGVVGNTDELLWRPDLQAHLEGLAPALTPLIKAIFEDVAPYTRDALGEERINWLQQLPAEQRDGELLLVHARPGELWQAPPPDAEDHELAGTYARGRVPRGLRPHPPAVCPHYWFANCGEQRWRRDVIRRRPARRLPARRQGRSNVRRVDYGRKRRERDSPDGAIRPRTAITTILRPGRFGMPVAERD